MLFTSCIELVPNEPRLTWITWGFGESNEKCTARIEGNVISVLAGKTVIITAGGLDQLYNDMDELESPYWTLYHDEDVNSFNIGKLNTSYGRTVKFTASDEVGATGKISIVVEQPEFDIIKDKVIKVMIVKELPELEK